MATVQDSVDVRFDGISAVVSLRFKIPAGTGSEQKRKETKEKRTEVTSR